MIVVLKQALLITSFVVIMMLLIEYINVQTRGIWQRVLRQSRSGQILLGALQPTSGSASLLGGPYRDLAPAERARVGYLAEGHFRYGWMRIEQLARFVSRTHPRWDAVRYQEFLD